MKPQKRFKKVYVEISNICNLQCDFCPEVEREKTVMGPELFKKIIAEIAPLTEEVCFHLMGEPLAHPLFSDYVGLCAGEGLPVNITSNGLLLNDARAEALLSPIVRQVNFSLHSFQANFGAKDFVPYLDKIFDFTKLAFERRPDLYINYRLWNLAGSESINNRAMLSHIEKAFGALLGRRVDVRSRKNENVVHRLSMNFDTRFEWPSPKAPVRGSAGFCHALSSHVGILADGTVVPCCLDKEGVMSLGNGRDGVGQALAGERAVRIAEGFRKNRLVEDLCRRCTFISRFDGKIQRAGAAAGAV